MIARRLCWSVARPLSAVGRRAYHGGLCRDRGEYGAWDVPVCASKLLFIILIKEILAA